MLRQDKGKATKLKITSKTSPYIYVACCSRNQYYELNQKLTSVSSLLTPEPKISKLRATPQ